MYFLKKAKREAKKKKYNNAVVQIWQKGCLDLINLVDKSGDDMMMGVLISLFVEAGLAMRRRIPALDLQEGIVDKKISKEEYDEKYVKAIHEPCSKSFYPYHEISHPIVRPAVDIADIMLAVREEYERRK